jgi:predicted TIM-barrel enzyme
MNRGKILEAWRKKRASGAPILGGPMGPDFITVSNYEQLSPTPATPLAGLLPLGDANALSLSGAKERVPKAGATPVIAGVCATDPLRLMDQFLQELKAVGVSGVQNRPSVGLIDGSFRKTLEETRMGYPREIEMIGLASKLDLLTAATAFTPEDARKMAEAGADVVVVHPGLSDPKEQGKRMAEIAAAAREARKNILVFGAGAGPDGLDGIQSE